MKEGYNYIRFMRVSLRYSAHLSDRTVGVCAVIDIRVNAGIELVCDVVGVMANVR